MCCEYEPEWLNRLPHLPHSNGFSPVCKRLCSAKWCLCLNALLQVSQTNGRMPECSYLWRAKEDCLLNILSHWSHAYMFVVDEESADEKADALFTLTDDDATIWFFHDLRRGVAEAEWPTESGLPCSLLSCWLLNTLKLLSSALHVLDELLLLLWLLLLMLVLALTLLLLLRLAGFQ